MKLLHVAPRIGAQWVREGLLSFRSQPLVFFSLFMLFTVIVVLVLRLPMVGGPIAVALSPALTLAMMAATEHSIRARTAPVPPSGISALNALPLVAALQAVRAQAKPLALLGFLYAVGVLAVSWIATLIAGDPFAQAFNEAGAPRADVIESPVFQFALLLRMGLYVPVALAFWHAPALVHWHGVPPIKSLFFSMVTCMRNFGAMAMYGLLWLGLLLAASIVLSLIGGLAMVGAGAGVSMAVMIGGSFVMSAMFLASTWFSFRDSFQAD